MAQKSNLSVPNDEPIIIIRQSLVNLTGCAVQAALLNYFDYWHFIKKESNKQSAHRNKVAERHGDRPTQDTSLLQYHTLKSIEKDMMGVAKLTKVKAAINELENRGFISKHQNPNPRYRFDRTVYYRFHPDAVNLAIAEMQMNTQKSQTDHGAIKNDSCLDEYDSPLAH